MTNTDNISSFVEELLPGSHISCLYSSPKDLRPILVPYIKKAFDNNEQCLYIHTQTFHDDIKTALSEIGINPEEMISSKKLILKSPEEVYYGNKIFEEEKMVQQLKTTIKTASNLGFNGLKGIGDCSWLNTEEDIKNFMKYESKLNKFFEDLETTSLCLYNPELFSNQAIVDIIRTHPLIYYKGRIIESKYFEPSSNFTPISGTAQNNTEFIIESTLSGI